MKYTQLKKKIKEKVIDIVYSLILKKKFQKGDKILLTSIDGIGDVIVRQKLSEEFLRKYGKDRIYVLCLDKTTPIFRKMGFKNIIEYTRDHRKRISGKLKLIEKIGELGIGEIVALEFDQHDIYIKYFKDIRKTAFRNPNHPEMDKYYDKHIERRKGSVLNDVREFMKEYFSREMTLNEVRPDFKDAYVKAESYNDCITFGIGSNSTRRIVSPVTMAEIVKVLRNNQSSKIVLLGYGAREDKIAAEIIEYAGSDRIINLVGKKTLDETISIINASKFYVGLDSGLYNFAFALQKPVIAFFEKEHPFAHSSFERIKILTGERNMRKKNFVEDTRYGTYQLNNISIDDFKNQLIELLKDISESDF